MEVERLHYSSSANNHHKIDFYQKEYNAYTDVGNHLDYGGIIDHYITHHLMDKLFFSVNDLLQKGYQYNPRARILIDHINVLNSINDSEVVNENDILFFPGFSEVKDEYIYYKYLDSKIILQQLDVLGLLTFVDGKIQMTELGSKLLLAKSIPLSSPKKKEEFIGFCKYCSNRTNLKVCITCRVSRTDMTLYEKSNRF